MKFSQIPPGFVQKIHLRKFDPNLVTIRHLQTQQPCTFQPIAQARVTLPFPA